MLFNETGSPIRKPADLDLRDFRISNRSCCGITGFKSTANAKSGWGGYPKQATDDRSLCRSLVVATISTSYLNSQFIIQQCTVHDQGSSYEGFCRVCRKERVL